MQNGSSDYGKKSGADQKSWGLNHNKGKGAKARRARQNKAIETKRRQAAKKALRRGDY